MPANTVVVSRPSKFGNVFYVGDGISDTPGMAAAHFREWMRHRCLSFLANQLAVQAREELRGKNLACWCPLDQPCHADTLLELANGPS